MKNHLYINNLYNFNPKAIHIDYSKALKKAILSKESFKNTPTTIHCFFHFVQNIVRKMKLLKIIKSRITKKSFEIIKNIKLTCFLPFSYINILNF